MREYIAHVRHTDVIATSEMFKPIYRFAIDSVKEAIDDDRVDIVEIGIDGFIKDKYWVYNEKWTFGDVVWWNVVVEDRARRKTVVVYTKEV